MDVPVPDVEDDRTDREEHRDEECEEDDDLTALPRRAAQPPPQHVGTSPVISVGGCSSRIVALARSVSFPRLVIGENLYGASRWTFTGSPGSFVVDG